MLTKISSNIIIDHSGFGDFDIDVVGKLISVVVKNMSIAISNSPFAYKNILIQSTEAYPTIIDVNGEHIIKLTTHDNYWCQWIYQFAHEYCHHLIDGKMIAYVDGLLWFEETLCEACSIYCLISIENEWEELFPEYVEYKEAIRSYVYDLLIGDGDCKSELYYINRAENKYNRSLYNYWATRIWVPLLIDNPALWKVLRHIGDIYSWTSLDDLLKHLEQSADSSYLQSIKKCNNLFKLYIDIE